MNIASLTFMILVLPVLLLLYYCIPGKSKEVCLLLSSWLLYSWGGPVRLLYLFAYILYDYIIGILLEKSRNHRIVSILLLSVSIVLQTGGLMVVRQVTGGTGSFVFPFGIAWYTVQGLGYLIRIYRGRIAAAVQPLRLALYLSFFPLHFAGPLVSFQEFTQQLEHRRCNILRLGKGLGLLICGLAEKVLLADTLRYVFEELRQTNASGMSMLTAWLTVIAFSLHLYFELLGYSEMARGLAECFGIQLPKNFHHPFFSLSVTKFTENWNITVNVWFQQNFRYALFGSVSHRWQKYGGLILMWILIGAWYGMQMQFLVWGLCIGLLVMAEELVLRKFLQKNQIIALLYTTIVLQFTWVLFFCDQFADVGYYWRAMLGFGTGFADQNSIYFFTSYAPLLLVSTYIATDLFRNITERIAGTKWGRRASMLIPAVESMLLVLSLASLQNAGSGAMLWLKL